MPRRPRKPHPQPAYFLKLTLENVRCFGPRQTLDLSDGAGRPARWTVILGDNGTGKTTLLQALVAMQPYPTASEKKDGIWQLHWQWYNRRLAHHPKQKVSIGAHYAIGALLSEQGHSRRAVEEGFVEGEDDFSHCEIFEHPDWRLAVHAYGAARRLGSGTLADSPLWPDPVLDRVGPDAAVHSLFDPEARLLNAEAWLAEKDYLASKKGAGQTAARGQFAHAVRLLRELFPDDDIKDIQCVPIEQGTRNGRVEVQAKTPYGMVPLRELSLGHQTVTAWIVDLAARMFVRYPDSSNPLKENAVVLVDEIDLHLHPRWQRKLFQRLTDNFPNVQFIVTAHSPLVVQAAPRDTRLVVLRRPAGKDYVIIDIRPGAVRNWRVDQILTSDLFELPSARPPEFDDKYARQEALLAKAVLTPREEAELASIDQWLAANDGGADSADEVRYLDILRRAAGQARRRPQRASRP